MKRYIFTQRNGIHILDLQQTLGLINDAYAAMVKVAAEGGTILFVGTKKQAQDVIQLEAERCGMWYVNQRWLGGTLTNFQTIRTRINYMLELQQKREQGYFRLLPKKEGVKLTDTLNRLEKYFLGLKDMTAPPQAMFVIDIAKEDICIAEARRMGVKIFSIVDSDCNPDLIDHPMPGNDDAVRSIKLITNRMASAVLEGKAQREALLAEANLNNQENPDPTRSANEQLTDEELEQISVETMPLAELGQLMEQASSYRTDLAEDDTSANSEQPSA
jgi:small subunit ribosomal protein S2